MDGQLYNIHFAGLRKAIRSPDISIAAKALLANLILYAGQNGNCFPSELTLGNDFGVTDRYIRDLLQILGTNGLIRWRRGKPGQSNKYTLSTEIYQPKSRNSGSAEIGTPVPSQTGTIVPTKVISESNHHKGSQVLLHFEETFNKKCSPSEAIRLQRLSRDYSDSWVLDAITEASKRKKPFVTAGLIGLILKDWAQDGRPSPRPVYNPCGIGGCIRGLIRNPNGESYRICDCKVRYERELEVWKVSGSNS